jgi:hypothetical protein
MTQLTPSVLTLTDDQVMATNELETWWRMGLKKREHLLIGAAGTGKSTLIAHWISLHPEIKVVMLAPTNKAAKVLKEKLTFQADVSTIHAILGLVVQETGGNYKVKGSRVIRDSESQILDTGSTKMDNTYDLIIVDEVSVLDLEVETKIRQKATEIKSKILWVGDECQLPPPGKKPSSVFSIKSSSILEQVVRFDAGALKVADYLRKLIKVQTPEKLPLEQILSTQEELEEKYHNVFLLSEGDWFGKIREYALAQKEYKVLAHRNEKVCSYNNLIRALRGIDDKPFSSGEQLLSLKRNLYQKFENGQVRRISFTNGEEVEVVFSQKTVKRFCDPLPEKGLDIFDAKEVVDFTLNFQQWKNYPVEVWDTEVRSLDRPAAWRLIFVDPSKHQQMVDTLNRSKSIQEDIQFVTNVLYRVQEMTTGKSGYDRNPDTEELASEILKYIGTQYKDEVIAIGNVLQKNCKALYGAYKEWQNLCFLTYHWSYNNAITVYKSQGSGWDTVFVDGEDIYSAPNWKKLLYVAVTRAKKQVFIKE